MIEKNKTYMQGLERDPVQMETKRDINEYKIAPALREYLESIHSRKKLIETFY